MSLKEKTLKGALWSGVRSWGARAFGLIVFFLLARLLEPQAFGLVALASVFIAFAQVFLEESFTQALIQRERLESEHLDTAFWINLTAGVLLMLLGFFGAPLFALVVSEPVLTPIIRWLSLCFLLSSLSSVQNAVLQRDFAYKSLAIRHLAGVFAGGLTGVGMAFLGYGVWSLVGQQLVHLSVSTIVLWTFSSWRPGFGVRRRHFNDIFSFEISMLGSRLLNFFSRRTGDFLIGVFLGPVALGYYAIANKIIFILNDMFIYSLTPVAFSSLSRLQTDVSRMRNAFYRATSLSSLLAFPAFIGLALLAPEIITSVVGEKWAASIPVMQVLAFVGILKSVTIFNGIVIKAFGKASWSLGLMFLSTVGSVLSFFVAVRFGIVAVAAAYVISQYILSPTGLFLVDRLIHLDWKIYLRQYASPTFASLLMVFVVFVTRHFLVLSNPHLALGVYVLAGVVTYAVGVRLMAPTLYLYLLELLRTVFRRTPLTKMQGTE